MTTRHRLHGLWRRVRFAAQRDAGFTLIEVVVSFTIFAIVGAGAATAIYRAINASHLTQQRVGAAAVAQQYVADAITRANADHVVPEEQEAKVLNLGDGHSASKEEFTVIRTIRFEDSNQHTCTPGTVFTVNVVVKQAQTGQFLARADTVVACPPA